MGTVSKTIADEVIAGKYPEDNIVKIVRYKNVFTRQYSFGLIARGQPMDTYKASEYVIEPTIYWEKSSMGLSIVRVLMTRDGMSKAEADAFIEELKERVGEGEDPETLLFEELGLEPDYIFELI